VKVTIQWKDPDAALVHIEGELPDKAKLVRRGDVYNLPDDIKEKLVEIGFDEYLVVEFDLEAMTGRVVKS
jgi:hypothetical protein